VRNIDRTAPTVLEAAVRQGAAAAGEPGLRRLDDQQNAGFVATPGDTIGRWQPNIPRWQRNGTGEPPLRDK
jgi:iron complex outermembrane receptor protein